MEAISFPLMYYVWNQSIVVTSLIYICAILTFQIAWALVQISHLSLIPELTGFSLERGKLTSIRYVYHLVYRDYTARIENVIFLTLL